MTITFIVPVRHPDNMRNREMEKRHTAETIRSICAQDHEDWRAVIVANAGTDLPALPPDPRLSVQTVDCPPNPRHELEGDDKESWYESVRLDKGRRILAGMLSQPAPDYYMVVDNDDFVSRRIAGFLARHPGANGFYIGKGYVWRDGSRFLHRHDNLNGVCGTTLIIRSDLYGLPQRIEDASDEYIKRMLGSHHFIRPHLEQRGHPLSELPFRGSVYRTQHENAHSRDAHLSRKRSVLPRWILGWVKRTLKKALCCQSLRAGMKREFWGVS